MRTAKVIDFIVDWLKTRCDTAGLQGFVVAVSGGIDSAVTSALCARTGKRTLLLNLPIYQPEEQISLGRQHIAFLERSHSNVEGIGVDLTPAFQALERTLPVGIQDDLTMANARSRTRMLTLFAFANHHRLLVAGTGNKVEDFGVGFYTKYGDGGVDISPIADLMKSEVYLLGRELGVIEEILNAPPTDGLWNDNRTDEGQLGASYDELEWAMGFDPESDEEDQLNARQQEVLSIYRKWNAANRHKMEPIPIAKIPDALRQNTGDW